MLAEEVALSITKSNKVADPFKSLPQPTALEKLVEALLKCSDYERVLHTVQRSWLQAETRAFAFQNFDLVLGLIFLKPDIGAALYQAFRWVDTFQGKLSLSASTIREIEIVRNLHGGVPYCNFVDSGQ